jgi:cyclomaltodextrinase / maltogenic alpha-amylase / neopullulanase
VAVCSIHCVAQKDFTPDWSKGIVWYQVFPERFANGDGKNIWFNLQRRRYGGDLQGVLNKLDYIYCT